ncbi:MAG TPA: hypothetical protein VJX94_28760 [Stellaceae bacterium]|nr:hypothetical protein [Stellaceae bacterium]
MKPRPASAVGEHSQELLLAAGYGQPEIHSMRAAGVIGRASHEKGARLVSETDSRVLYRFVES